MSRPRGHTLAVKDQYSALRVESLWAITYQGEIVQIAEDIYVSLSNQIKYPKSVYRTKASALNHCAKLNKMFITNEFSIVCLYQRTSKNKE